MTDVGKDFIEFDDLIKFVREKIGEKRDCKGIDCIKCKHCGYNDYKDKTCYKEITEKI